MSTKRRFCRKAIALSTGPRPCACGGHQRGIRQPVYPGSRPVPGSRKVASVGRRYATGAPSDHARPGPPRALQALGRSRPHWGPPLALPEQSDLGSGTPDLPFWTPISPSWDPFWTLPGPWFRGQKPADRSPFVLAWMGVLEVRGVHKPPINGLLGSRKRPLFDKNLRSGPFSEFLSDPPFLDLCDGF